MVPLAKSYVKPAGGIEDTDTETARQWLVEGHPLRNGTLEGLVPDHGAVEHALPVNGSYTIPQGYHNGEGRITQSVPYKMAGEHATGSGLNTLGLYYYFTPGYYETDGHSGAWIYRTRAEIAAAIGLNAAILKKGAAVLDITGTYTGDSSLFLAIGGYGKNYDSERPQSLGAIANVTIPSFAGAVLQAGVPRALINVNPITFVAPYNGRYQTVASFWCDNTATPQSFQKGQTVSLRINSAAGGGFLGVFGFTP